MVRDEDANRSGKGSERRYIEEAPERTNRDARRYLSHLRIQVEARRTLRLA